MMAKNILLWSLCVALVYCTTKPVKDSPIQKKQASKTATAQYDSLLAKKLGADKFGMKRYVMAFLRKGKVQIKDSVERAKLQQKHLQNIIRLAEAGKLIVAGPFLENKDIRGIFIFNVESVDEAQKLTATDPAIQAGTLEMELHPWYGSAALVETPQIHKKLEQKSVAEAK